MAFWCFMLVCDLLIPGVLIIFGARFLKKPPSRINGLYGYRTARSMRSQAAWDFAHRHCGRLFRATGRAMLPLSVLAMLPTLGRESDFVGVWGGIVVMVQLFAAFVPPLVSTERALKRRFDEYGRPQSP